MTRKVLAAERTVSDLAEQANNLIKQGKDVTDIGNKFILFIILLILYYN